jgi:ubiquinone/menaquinone biosynthesis C-methylase UbiE
MSFDSLARHYRWMEFVLAGDKLQRCRTAFLHKTTAAQRVLIVGEGNGRFLAACRQAIPFAFITVADSSRRMLDAARTRLARRVKDSDNVEFVHADARTWMPPNAAYDLIVTHFFLDCFPDNQLERVITNLATAAKPTAAWLLADFQMPADGLQHHRAKAIHALMYAFFRVATKLPARRLISPDSYLRAHGFELKEKRTSEWELLHSDLWQRGVFNDCPGRPPLPPAAGHAA